MDKVCAIIDAQGFHANGRFFPREIAIITKNFKMCVEMDTKLDYINLSSSDCRTNMFIEKHLLGMTLRSDSTLNCDNIITKIYQLIADNDKYLFGVKNYQLERILKRLEIPYINLQCPTVVSLDAQYGYWQCDNHTAIPRGRCALRKCMHILEWMTSQDTPIFEIL